MNPTIRQLIIVGGGSAGWLTAAVVAAEHKSRIANQELTITLIESPHVQAIGVGEGTWPTMPQTLQRIGISEADFVKHCSASFKQGSKFVNWRSANQPEHYYHPFDVPEGALQGVLADSWSDINYNKSFAECFSLQPALERAFLAPKTISTPEYQGIANYGYHLDAVAFAELLQRHCTEQLGVTHIQADVTDVIQSHDETITAVVLDSGERIAGDLFVDCSGFKSLLLGQALGVNNVPVDDVLFADTALAVHADYPESDSPIGSFTSSTAQDSGWIWDIGLQHRRGIGYVFSSRHSSDEEAKQVLQDYLKQSGVNQAGDIRKISFQSGYKEKFWQRNCVAIGLSAGFIEPLEASALVMIELSATMLAEQLPKTPAQLPIIAARFNDTFRYRWERVIEFLKLHYVLSERTSAFWQDNRHPDSIPERLTKLLTLWENQVPTQHDFDRIGEIFQAPSYQYVFYGSGAKTQHPFAVDDALNKWSQQQFEHIQYRKNEYLNALPSNRELINKINKYGLAKV